jgi:hypothetical protein
MEGLVRARMQLTTTLTITGLMTYLVTVLAVSGRTTDAPINLTGDPIAWAASLYLVGAIAGLFKCLSDESLNYEAVEDYGLAGVRLALTPVLSGLAAVGGVLLVGLIPAIAVRLAAPRLDDVFSLTANPFALIEAAVFGLAPTLLISRLRAATDRYTPSAPESPTKSANHQTGFYPAALARTCVLLPGVALVSTILIGLLPGLVGAEWAPQIADQSIVIGSLAGLLALLAAARVVRRETTIELARPDLYRQLLEVRQQLDKQLEEPGSEGDGSETESLPPAFGDLDTARAARDEARAHMDAFSQELRRERLGWVFGTGYSRLWTHLDPSGPIWTVRKRPSYRWRPASTSSSRPCLIKSDSSAARSRARLDWRMA